MKEDEEKIKTEAIKDYSEQHRCSLLSTINELERIIAESNVETVYFDELMKAFLMASQVFSTLVISVVGIRCKYTDETIIKSAAKDICNGVYKDIVLRNIEEGMKQIQDTIEINNERLKKNRVQNKNS